MKLKPYETCLEGKWILRDGRIFADEVCTRIEDLKRNHLEKVAADESGWDTLLRDPADGRYWEQIHAHSELHGGGPPSLVQISIEQAESKYGVTLRR